MMLERWKHHEGKEIDVFEEFKVLTSEVISKTAFGSSYLEGKDIFEKLSKMVFLVSRNTLRIRLPDLLGLLVEAYNDTDEKSRITLEDVVDNCKTFYVAGHETTTSLLSWTILLLAINREWQDKLRKEVLGLFGEQNPTAEGFARMKQMTMVINETLRLYSPAPGFTREVQWESKLGRLVLPANLTLIISILSLHIDPLIWGEDVHLFNPERFSGGVAKATNNNPAAYLPFGLGPRNCVGMNFAINEAKIALSMILQRYTFTLSPTYIHSPVWQLVLRPENGIQVMLHPLYMYQGVHWVQNSLKINIKSK
ncbi:hypothetical protein RHMOL_Rhmol09G0176400 [Rhododendron molle]|uniref:Uncharacterized protein n=1 Tax=Rhododendron molle TaxID=49168 RepID=A0ACC0ME80_RHOML|nr:hypothetical protein RHMOL_Rhmol09G0176400 [Rhododendron molle]